MSGIARFAALDGWSVLCYSRIGTTKVGAPLFAPLEGWGYDSGRGTTFSSLSSDAVEVSRKWATAWPPRFSPRQQSVY
jgi:hypothetical protein